MRLDDRARRLRILIGEDDQWHRTPLWHEIVRRARQDGLAGASVPRGIRSPSLRS